MKMKVVKFEKIRCTTKNAARRVKAASQREMERKFRRTWRQAQDKIEFVCVPVSTGYRD